ncbi:sulfur carrier protein ThiS [Alteribacter populi]|uniref:sulfur carrier protein ThiS n=1 Tax=Alteribacter populi TaxID=2011011 RepID=UPI000BBAE522|nr:sulfur carrier protein ThiS [Alteribacter populi]
MRLFINGEEHHLEVTSLSEIISHFQLEPKLVVAEVDGNIVDRDDWSDTTTKADMKIELVQFIGGG